uniref:Protein-associating with the carboxyl-terminal domain of ezrin n=1 Tax=Timema cristinae TaxID=61476 RepID=A0A7R9CEJ2_TIMCR|nr:unnamed protein product [Timema cristinae]
MMGSEGSRLPGLEIEDKAVQVTDGWTLYSATITTGTTSSLSVFISYNSIGCVISKANAASFEKAAKNLMLYRHPCILKFISSWHKNGNTYLATENVCPLSQVLSGQTSLQICIGLHSILKALVFLHEKLANALVVLNSTAEDGEIEALSSHNNVCCAAVYVIPDGTWKLGGLEYLCRFSELTTSYLQETRAHRYEKGVAPEEENTKSSNISQQYSCIDQFAFGVLAEEVLSKKPEDDVPAMADFQELCKKQLQNIEPSVRPKLSSLLEHPFFTHSYIKIHSFLEELPLKSDLEKQLFFRSLVTELESLPEELIASQLGSLLLSRLVLLDTTAQQNFLPRVLCPSDSGHLGLFTIATYKKYLVPKLIHMFCVRDAQVRLLLLTHFSKFCNVFTNEQLKEQILPEVHNSHKSNPKTIKSPIHVQDLSSQLRVNTVSIGADTDSAASYETLPERPSPDGGEDKTTTTSDEETEAWSDWDVPDSNGGVSVGEKEEVPLSKQDSPRHVSSPLKDSTTTRTSSGQNSLPDITTLDIKMSSPLPTVGKHRDEIDFFQDMEPVISKTSVLRVSEETPKSKFDVSLVSGGEEEGWYDDLEDWGDIGK